MLIKKGVRRDKENTDQKNSEYEPFSRNEVILLKFLWKPKIPTQSIMHKHLTKKGESNMFAKFWHS